MSCLQTSSFTICVTFLISSFTREWFTQCSEKHNMMYITGKLTFSWFRIYIQFLATVLPDLRNSAPKFSSIIPKLCYISSFSIHLHLFKILNFSRLNPFKLRSPSPATSPRLLVPFHDFTILTPLQNFSKFSFETCQPLYNSPLIHVSQPIPPVAPGHRRVKKVVKEAGRHGERRQKVGGA